MLKKMIYISLYLIIITFSTFSVIEQFQHFWMLIALHGFLAYIVIFHSKSNTKFNFIDILFWISSTLKYSIIPFLMIIIGKLDIGFGSSVAVPYYRDAILYMSIELIVYFLIYYKLKNSAKIKTKKNINKSASNNYLYLLIVLLGIITLVVFPEIRSRYNFITDSIDLTASEVISSYDTGLNALFSFSNYLRIIWPPLIIGFMYKKYSLNRKFLYILLSMILSFIPSLFYIVTSRNSILLPAAASLFLLLYLYKDKRKAILSIYGISLITVVLIMTLSKSTSDFSSILGIVNYLSVYFLGPKEYAIGLASIFQYNSYINVSTLFNDLFGNVPFISNFSNLSNRTVQFYNYTYYSNPNLGTGGGFIIPMFIQFSFFVGKVFAPLFSGLAIIFIVKISKFSINRNSINRLYLVAYVGSYMALFFSNNFSSLINLLMYTYFPLVIIDIMQNFLFSKIRFRKVV